MSGVIKKEHVLRRIREKTQFVFYPNGRYAPCYHTQVAVLVSTVILLNVYVLNNSEWSKSLVESIHIVIVKNTIYPKHAHHVVTICFGTQSIGIVWIGFFNNTYFMLIRMTQIT